MAIFGSPTPMVALLFSIVCVELAATACESSMPSRTMASPAMWLIATEGKGSMAWLNGHLSCTRYSQKCLSCTLCRQNRSPKLSLLQEFPRLLVIVGVAEDSLR